MALKEAEAQDEELVAAPRRKTPLFLLLGGAGVLGVIVLWGLKTSMTVETPPAEGHTQHAANPEGSSMVRMLEQHRAEALAQEEQASGAVAPGTSGGVPEGTTSSVAASPGQGAGAPFAGDPGAYVPPTNSVPRYPFAGSSNCEELPSLPERLACLDSQFVFETRRARLKEVGNSMTSDDNFSMWGDGEGGRREGEPAGGQGMRAPSWGMQDGMGLGGSDGPEGRGPQAGRDSAIDFHRNGGAELDPKRRVGAQQAPSSRLWLRAGSILPCAFISGVTSQLPGQVEAQITQNVYDSIDYTYLLIPAGSMLVGRPNPETRQGQDRIQFAWTELHLPDGEFRELGGMAGADGAGYAGVQGKVDRHWGRKLGLALMTSTVNIAFHLATPTPGAGGMQDAVAQGVGEGVVQVASENLRKMMEIPDEIVIRPGQTCSVKVEQSMEFPRPYSDGKRWRR